MDTRGKSTEQIRQAVEELADKLPAGHPLRDVPKTFPDRGQAISAFTNMRQTLFQLDRKESTTMASKKVAAAETPTETKEAVKAKAVKAAAKPGKEPKAAKAVKAKTNGDKAATNGDKAPAKAAKEKTERKASVDLTGPFKLSKEAAEAKSPEALRLHEGSSRFTLMTFVFGSKKQKFTTEELVAAVGDQGRQALSGMVRYGFLVPAA